MFAAKNAYIIQRSAIVLFTVYPVFFIHRKMNQELNITSGYVKWFTAGGAIRIAHYDVIDGIITRKL